jgi:hypothetical protein
MLALVGCASISRDGAVRVATLANNALADTLTALVKDHDRMTVQLWQERRRACMSASPPEQPKCYIDARNTVDRETRDERDALTRAVLAQRLAAEALETARGCRDDACLGEQLETAERLLAELRTELARLGGVPRVAP